MDANLWLTGAWPFIMLVSAALTALISIFLLWLFRSAVLRGMSARAGATEAPTSSVGTGAAAAAGIQLLGIVTVDRRTALAKTSEADVNYSRRTLPGECILLSRGHLADDYAAAGHRQ